jgi:predicted methyltransferase
MVARIQIANALILSVLLAACSPANDAGQPAQATSSDAAAPAAAPGLRDRLAAESRPQADRDRDAGRKPADVIEFLGIEPGMAVIDLIAAGGYYTEVLAISVGPNGRVVAHNTDGVLKMRDGVNEKALSERLANNRLPNVSRLNKEFKDLSAADGSFDAAITALNFHDIYNGAGPDAAVQVLRTVRGMLKPGGVFGIIDHVGVEGADNAALHRIEKARAIETAEAAGFVVEASSDILANPADDHTQGVFAEGLRGNTDRFVLKLRNPAN